MLDASARMRQGLVRCERELTMIQDGLGLALPLGFYASPSFSESVAHEMYCLDLPRSDQALNQWYKKIRI
jgi:hypothetical protein